MVDYFGECECVELRYGGSASASRPFGQGLGTIETLLAWWSRQKGRPARDNRLFLNAVFWILRTGAPWRDLPPDYGDWKNTIDAFAGGETAVSWDQLLERGIEDPDFEWLMVDASHIKVHPHGTGARGGNQAIGRTKGAKQQTAPGGGLPRHAGTL